MTGTAVYEAPKNLEDMARLRAIAPVVRVRTPTGVESWVVMTYELSKQLLGDHRLGREPLVKGGSLPYRAQFPEYLKSTLLFKDDPEHARLRKSVARWFTARRIEQLRERTTATANRLLDAIEAKGEPVDLIESYAAPLPIDVLVSLLGADITMTDSFLEWNRDLLATGNHDPDKVAQSLRDCDAYLRSEIRRKRTEPGEDLLSALAQIPDGDEGSLSEDEILSIAMLILLAGFDNTANTIGAGVYALLGHPDQLAGYLEDVDGKTATLTEEVLRHGRQAMGSGLMNAGVPFVALEDIEVAGVSIAKGDFVVVNRNSANHDEMEFPSPEVFDTARTPNPHLGLSHGIHHCLGAPLARMELQVAFSALFTRFPRLTLAGKPEYLEGTVSQPMTYLPVAL